MSAESDAPNFAGRSKLKGHVANPALNRDYHAKITEEPQTASEFTETRIDFADRNFH